LLTTRHSPHFARSCPATTSTTSTTSTTRTGRTLRGPAGSLCQGGIGSIAGVYLIGLTGGIASGKSTVASALVAHGAVLIDADLLAREAVEPGSAGLAAIVREFGATLVGADGGLDRAALGAIVFGDQAALARLNEIVHPAVRALCTERIRATESADPAAVIVYDVPLLAEADAGAAVDRPFDLVVVTQATPETRMQRMVDLRGMSRDDATRRIRSQANDADRLAIADVVIDTNGTLEHTERQVDELWARVHGAGNAAGTESVGGRI